MLELLVVLELLGWWCCWSEISYYIVVGVGVIYYIVVGVLVWSLCFGCVPYVLGVVGSAVVDLLDLLELVVLVVIFSFFDIVSVAGVVGWNH